MDGIGGDGCTANGAVDALAVGELEAGSGIDWGRTEEHKALGADDGDVLNGAAHAGGRGSESLNISIGYSNRGLGFGGGAAARRDANGRAVLAGKGRWRDGDRCGA